MRIPFCIATCSLLLAACPATNTDSLTVREAQQALEESSLSSQADTLLANGVEISTHFTIGDAIEKAADDLRAFIASQLPCADITLSGATLTVEYGGNAGSCLWNGHTFSGNHEISVMRNDDEVLVHHTWTDFSNGKLAATGEADVTWSRANASRRVVHDVTWTVLTGALAGRTGTGSGDRTQTALAGGIAEGIRIDGMRAWDGARGHFELDIDGVEVRWSDPVPQAGAYVLTAPSGKTLTMDFTRIDDATIQVEITNGSRSLHFEVTALGHVSESER